MVPEESEEEMDAILIGDSSHKLSLLAMMGDAKGPVPAAVGWFSRRLEEAGYNGGGIAMT